MIGIQTHVYIFIASEIFSSIGIYSLMIKIASQIRTLQSEVDDIFEQLAPRNNPTFTGTVSGLDITTVGLSNVDNTSDADKPISTKTKKRVG